MHAYGPEIYGISGDKVLIRPNDIIREYEKKVLNLDLQYVICQVRAMDFLKALDRTRTFYSLHDNAPFVKTNTPNELILLDKVNITSLRVHHVA